MKQINKEQALTRLAAYCSRGERCKQDIQKKLDLWKLSPQEQNEIIQTLQKGRFLNEDRYAKAFVRDKSRFNGWGGYKIRMELKKKNITEETINEALSEIDPEESIRQLSELLKKKSKTIKAESDWETKQKLMRFAVGRGFSLDQVEKALRVSPFM